MIMKTDGQQPIYQIYLLKEPAKELMLNDGRSTGWPDTSGESVGFYYELESAIDALHHNVLDIQDGIYKAAFILCKFPGLYNSASDNLRQYFVWDENKNGFWEADEPEIFDHIAI